MGRLEKLRSEKPAVLLIKIGIPSLLGQVVLSIYNALESVLVGRFCGDLALVGVSNFLPTEYYLFSQTIASESAGAAVFISRAIGEDSKEQAGHFLAQQLLLCLMHAIIVPIMLIFILEPYLLLLGVTAQVIPLSLQYGRFMTIFGPLSYAVSSGFTGVLKSQNLATFAMLRQCVSAVINIGLDYYFLGVLKVGVQGAAWASCIAYCAMGAVTIVFFMTPFAPLRLRLNQFKPKLGSLLQIQQFGLLTFMGYSQTSLPQFFVPFLLRKLSQNDLETQHFQLVQGICSKVMTLLTMPLSGMQQGIQPVVAISISQREHQKTLKTIRSSLTICGSVGGLIAAVLMVFAQPITGLFTTDERVRTQCSGIIRLNMICTLCGVAQGIVVAVLQQQKRFWAAASLQLCKVVISCMWSWLGPLITGRVSTLFYATAAAEVVCGIASMAVLWQVIWRLRRDLNSDDQIVVYADVVLGKA